MPTFIHIGFFPLLIKEIGPEFSLPLYQCYNEEAEGHHNMISACPDGPIYQNDAAGPSNMVEGLPRLNEAVVGISNSGLETCIKEIYEKFDELSILEELQEEQNECLVKESRRPERRSSSDIAASGCFARPSKGNR
ncbi:uncharacterized protein LOC107622975 [Arachis ipaensis]|uniref:uncharacterized protein LOC107622975 n=1 Tax=Arachis ipaensis TaxID=130454 RepID=UPI0007AF4E9A|nr:uncharacterized protein LOC107622975 [Arachis ipaensis]